MSTDFSKGIYTTDPIALCRLAGEAYHAACKALETASAPRSGATQDELDALMAAVEDADEKHLEALAARDQMLAHR